MIENPKLFGIQSNPPRQPGGIFIYQPQRKLRLSEDPQDILTRLVLSDGYVKTVGEICEKNPQTAEWLIRKIATVDELRVRAGKASGRFEAYANAARQALCRVECNALLDSMREEK